LKYKTLLVFILWIVFTSFFISLITQEVVTNILNRAFFGVIDAFYKIDQIYVKGTPCVLSAIFSIVSLGLSKWIISFIYSPKEKQD